MGWMMRRRPLGSLTRRRFSTTARRPQRVPAAVAAVHVAPGGYDAGPCLRVRFLHRRTGRSCWSAAAAKPQGTLHAQREGGRLKPAFRGPLSVRVDTRGRARCNDSLQPEAEHGGGRGGRRRKEEDRGEVVEPAPWWRCGGGGVRKAQWCSRTVINNNGGHLYFGINDQAATMEYGSTMKSGCRSCRHRRTLSGAPAPPDPHPRREQQWRALGFLLVVDLFLVLLVGSVCLWMRAATAAASVVVVDEGTRRSPGVAG
ncbi:hypothetical protein ZWY2020_051686 [Hordeum vulgare]|nr:hypothetical protein ZWY2020_051686 [Hordeum vulgare]